jgi:hypothetical protein
MLKGSDSFRPACGHHHSQKKDGKFWGRAFYFNPVIGLWRAIIVSQTGQQFRFQGAHRCPGDRIGSK